MMILVMDHDGSKRMVAAKELQLLIENKAIQKFRREGEWVEIDVARIRGGGLLQKYFGPERRQSDA